MEMTARQMLGQKLVFGFHGTELSEEFKALIREYRVGNVILFLRNVRSADQLRRLCGEIQELILEVTGYPAFIVIDQEGGMVTRCPPMRSLSPVPWPSLPRTMPKMPGSLRRSPFGSFRVWASISTWPPCWM